MAFKANSCQQLSLDDSFMSLTEQPISDKTLSRFHKRCYDYETLHGVDLYHDCVKDLSGKIAKIVKLNGRICRMDSMMIESNIRFLSRMELIYTCISKLVVYVTTALIGKEEPDALTDFEFNEDGTCLLKCAAGQERNPVIWRS